MDILSGKIIFLRPLETTDLDVLYQWENLSEDWNTGSSLTPYSRFYLEQYIISAQNNIYEDKQLRLIIENYQSQVVGIIDLFDFNPHHRRAAVGLLIGREYRKRGYATEALDVLINYAKNILSLRQVYCSIEQNNPVSLELFQKKGFKHTGTRLNWNLRGNQWIHEDFLQLIF
jgi:diamine N-acetyltransferase